MDWGSYEARISWAERSAIQMAPLRVMPAPDHVNAYFPYELLRARREAHVYVTGISTSLGKRRMELDDFNICFTQCLTIASFELRHGFIASWPAFALLFHKIFGDAVLPWLPSLFLAALGQEGIPCPQFDLDEVLNFHARHPVAINLDKYAISV